METIRRHSEPEMLPRKSRMTIGRMLSDARQKKGWSREVLSVEAEKRLREAAADFVSPIYVTSEEREMWREVEVSARNVEYFEGEPSCPLGRGERRAKFRGICLALGLDFAQINRIAGGL